MEQVLSNAQESQPGADHRAGSDRRDVWMPPRLSQAKGS